MLLGFPPRQTRDCCTCSMRRNRLIVLPLKKARLLLFWTKSNKPNITLNSYLFFKCLFFFLACLCLQDPHVHFSWWHLLCICPSLHPTEKRHHKLYRSKKIRQISVVLLQKNDLRQCILWCAWYTHHTNEKIQCLHVVKWGKWGWVPVRTTWSSTVATSSLVSIGSSLSSSVVSESGKEIRV